MAGLAKARSFGSVSYNGPDEIQLHQDTESLARREGVDYSTLVKTISGDYVKRHLKSPNPQSTFDELPVALPTAWEKWDAGKFRDPQVYPDKEMAEIRSLLANNLKVVDREIETRAAAVRVRTPSPRCEKCNRPMVYGLEAHLYSHPDCRPKALPPADQAPAPLALETGVSSDTEVLE